MEFLDFCKAIQETVEKSNKSNGVAEKSLILLAELERIIKSNEVNKSLCMTQATILFEGFYRHLSKESLKNLHISSKNVHTRGLGRTQHKELIKKPCFICGYDKHVELCHIKPISEFPPETLVSEVNDISNVVQLCRNCHWEFDKMKIIKIVK